MGIGVKRHGGGHCSVASLALSMNFFLKKTDF